MDLSAATIARIDAALAPIERGPEIEITERWISSLPPALLHIWSSHGLVTLAGGRLRLVDPALFRPFLSYLTEGDVDLHGDTHAIALGNMGELAVWSERYGFGLLTWPIPSLQMTYMMDRSPPPSEDQIVTELLNMPAEVLDVWDANGDPMHDRIAAKLGPIERWEIYGATPTPARPLEVPVEDYVVADAIEWLEAHYTQMTTQLVDWLRPGSPILRAVGRPWPEGAARPPLAEEVRP
ncbi:GAD-like domain-containing protein [Jannaschia aquimarina]|uniref:GAD-like domain protein n=1 Tax=Jannaschia aquimarina TaxID=935700 RepID=A0A0D1EGX2_9RHOB|nr:GAD-like domain-containing protein [Jannaschia aquimarina]KIT16874.1 GAD-like domain protein [Jannaschia aquimarina]SNT12580.1 GAD-like domain-containing protein [Jannaschia aquimarina]